MIGFDDIEPTDEELAEIEELEEIGSRPAPRDEPIEKFYDRRMAPVTERDHLHRASRDAEQHELDAWWASACRQGSFLAKRLGPEADDEPSGKQRNSQNAIEGVVTYKQRAREHREALRDLRSRRKGQGLAPA